MDNKITKTRLSDFFAYEWIKIIIFMVVAILVWELIFTVAGVRLTTGQQFKILYDINLDDDTQDDIIPITYADGAFSYDVFKIDKEYIRQADVNVLSVRYETRDCDVIATSNKEVGEGESKNRQAFYIIDSINMTSYDKLVKDGEKYLLPLLKNEFSDDVTKVYDYEHFDENFSVSKINDLFLRRMKNDNRFRSNAQKQEGMKAEKARIEKLCKDLAMAKFLLENHSEIFLEYTKYEYSVTKNPTEHNQNVLKTEKERNIEEYGKEKQFYGIDLGKLTITESSENKHSASKFFAKDGSADEVILMAFDFLYYQPHLQFESLSFMNSVVHVCSNLLDGFYV